ncbi:MAG: tRNA (adenosine(37)-N6)-threonylcarbamoyltransferase complex ATPase subunit type 1 TsaE [Bifidobacteriaceae bacterium]|jgi:tRNA threonylcarbamoyl adenosine modification protein YjeE|nr:tRNA (adenosine(37)-N6)-threonylcarbamoyltransferase complex ATPase subunit type 1 TsaE [Bifidobacteriaceae bacterium]
MKNYSNKLYNQKIANLEQLDNYTKNLVDNIKLGDILLLMGPLGAGKTTFVKYLAKNLGIKDIIISPTFTIARNYKMPSGNSNDKYFIHIDAYRLGLFNNYSNNKKDYQKSIYDSLELLDIPSNYKNSIIVIEWGEIVKEYLTNFLADNNIIYVNINRTRGSQADETRTITINKRLAE